MDFDQFLKLAVDSAAQRLDKVGYATVSEHLRRLVRDGYPVPDAYEQTIKDLEPRNVAGRG